MKPLAYAFVLGLIGAAILPFECSAQVFDNPFSEYMQRDVRISPDGGNANDVNAAIHTIDPWPAHSRNTRIPGNGQATVGAVQQMYKKPSPFGSGSGKSTTTTNIGGDNGITTQTTSGQ